MRVKCLTLTQPWATLVAGGEKTIETRSWATPHRGPIAVHAALRFPTWAREFAQMDPGCRFALRRAGVESWRDLPRGRVLAVGELVDCVQVPEGGLTRTLLPQPWAGRLAGEDGFGDFAPGRWLWLLRDVRPLRAPVPAKGQLGLWEVEIPERAVA